MRFTSHIVLEEVADTFLLSQNLLNNQCKLSHSADSWCRHWLHLIDRLQDQRLQQWQLWFKKC